MFTTDTPCPLQIVREEAKVEAGVSVDSGLSWQRISNKLGSRSEHQCRHKWYSEVNWKQQQSANPSATDAWDVSDDLALVNGIEKTEATEPQDIKWPELLAIFAATKPRSAYFLQARFRVLSSRAKKDNPNAKLSGKPAD